MKTRTSDSDEPPKNEDDLGWFKDQLDQLAEHVEVNKPELTPVQLARLLRELCKGRDWRHGAWR